MSSYAYFVQTCREEHKKKHPDASVNFAEFSKKCSERWKVKSVAAHIYIFTILCNHGLLYFSPTTRRCHQKRKENLKTWQSKTRCAMRGKWRIMFPRRATRRSDSRTPMPLRDHRMSQIMARNYIFATQACHSVKFLMRFPRRSAFFLFCAEFRPKVKSENPGLTIGDTAKKLGEMWNSKTAEDKQPYEKKAAKLKEKYDKVITNRPKARKMIIFFVQKNQISVVPRTSLRTVQRAKWTQNRLPRRTMTRRRRTRKKEKRRKTTMKRMTSKL